MFRIKSGTQPLTRNKKISVCLQIMGAPVGRIRTCDVSHETPQEASSISDSPSQAPCAPLTKVPAIHEGVQRGWGICSGK